MKQYNYNISSYWLRSSRVPSGKSDETAAVDGIDRSDASRGPLSAVHSSLSAPISTMTFVDEDETTGNQGGIQGTDYFIKRKTLLLLKIKIMSGETRYYD